MSQSSLQYFRELAGFLRRDLRCDDPARVAGAVRRIHRALSGSAKTRVELLRAQFRHSDALTVIAREQGHSTWREFEDATVTQAPGGANSELVGLRDGDPKFYETLITVSVLSEDTPYSFRGYKSLAYDVIDGEYSGKVVEESVVRLSATELEERAGEHGSDPAFFSSYDELMRQIDDEEFGGDGADSDGASGPGSGPVPGGTPDASQEAPDGSVTQETPSDVVSEEVTRDVAPNTRFEYLYVDAGNNKRRRSVLLRGRMTVELLSRFEDALHEGEFFIAHQVGLGNLIPLNADPDLDHCWHSIEAFADMDEVFEPTSYPIRDDALTVNEFVEAFVAAAAHGWDDSWDPSDVLVKDSEKDEDDWCDTNDCEREECHRCYPRHGCTAHEKCVEFTESGEGI